MVDAISISDIHLGTNCCMALELENFLKNIEEKTKKLIINGDLFDSLNFVRLSKHHWKILTKLRKASDKIEIVWLSGNHDGPTEIISQLLGIEFTREYKLESGNKKILFLHGDRFDDFISNNPLLTWVGDFIYNLLQKMDNRQVIARWVKRNTKKYLRVKDKIKLKAIDYAKEKGYDVVCCGHTHFAESYNNIYYNSGCWTEPPGTFLEVNNGEISIKDIS